MCAKLGGYEALIVYWGIGISKDLIAKECDSNDKKMLSLLSTYYHLNAFLSYLIYTLQKPMMFWHLTISITIIFYSYYCCPILQLRNTEAQTV